MAKSTKKSVKPKVTGWAGWIYFTGIMLWLLGFFEIIIGLTALFNSQYFVVLPNTIVNLSFTTWGWTHFLFGALILITGLAIFMGQVWARVVAVILAALVALTNLLFIAAYPVWSVIAIVICIFVIYALIVHGRETDL